MMIDSNTPLPVALHRRWLRVAIVPCSPTSSLVEVLKYQVAFAPLGKLANISTDVRSIQAGSGFN
jgi:hypothetical protein